MYSDTEIQDCAQTIAERFNPQRIILFGSHANKTATSNSDVDLLVIMPYEGKSSRVALKIRRGLKKNFPLDLLVKDPLETERRIAQGDLFLKNAVQSGKVLYERSHPGMD
ncbi:MAG: nucleotidyltransferase domain-containing protein [Opitutales bacterium]|nr:nucleotidyltransferase domain-containing protein [Opitutales bacterium]